MAMNERPEIARPRITMTGQRWDRYGCPHTAIEIVMDLSLIPHTEKLADQLEQACNQARNQIEEDRRRTYYYEINFRNDVRDGLPGFAIYIYYSNTESLPPEGAASRERRAIPLFAEGIEEVLANYRENPKKPPEATTATSLWTDLGA